MRPRLPAAPSTVGRPGQATPLTSRLRTKKTYRFLTAAEGAQLHDAPMAPQRRNQIVFDWLGRVLRV